MYCHQIAWHDLYPLITPIRYGSKSKGVKPGVYRNAPFQSDPTLTGDSCQKVWTVLSDKTRDFYLSRMPTPGIEVLVGAPVRDAWADAVKDLGADWQVITTSVTVHVPAAQNAYGSFERSTYLLPVVRWMSHIGACIGSCTY